MSNFDAQLNEMKASLNNPAPSTSGKPFVPKKTDRPAAAQPTAPTPAAASTAIPTAREGAIALSATSHDAMNALQSQGLGNAAAYVKRKQAERNAIVDRVSDCIAALADPDLLESDIMNAASAKVAARSNAWEYEHCTAWDGMFALPDGSQRLLGGL